MLNTQVFFKYITELYQETPNCKFESNLNNTNLVFYEDNRPIIIVSSSIDFVFLKERNLTNLQNRIQLEKVPYIETAGIYYFLQSHKLTVLDLNSWGYSEKIEKLQTCDFKRKQYQKLLKELDLLVSYIYVLNSDWFDKPAYKDVLEYIESVNCNYCFDRLPLEWLGLPKPLKNK